MRRYKCFAVAKHLAQGGFIPTEHIKSPKGESGKTAGTQNKNSHPKMGVFVLERVTRLELASAPRENFVFVGAPHLRI